MNKVASTNGVASINEVASTKTTVVDNDTREIYKYIP
jgi:hypothetical protein